MAKSNRHKKLRKQEKAKTQLTGVKKLNKAKNVVEPHLRVKKILIREQLKSSKLPPENDSASLGLKSAASVVSDDQEEITSRRKQSLQELLSSVNHHNVNIRKDSLVGLQQIASCQIGAVIRHLDKVLAKMASLTSDPEAPVRKENKKLAELVVSKISENQLRPFWSMLIAHLKCTLTHLIPSVRHNALSFIELLANHHPLLMSESSSVILPSVLSIIATTSGSKQSNKSLQSNSSTRLKVEITGKQSDMIGRLNVIRLLGKFLAMRPQEYQDEGVSFRSSGPKSTEASQFLSLRYSFGYCWDQVDERTGLLEYSPDFISPGFCGRQFFSSIISESASSDNLHSTPTFWQDFINSCVPVLIETWVELEPLTHRGGTAEGTSNRKKKIKDSLFLGGNDKDATELNSGRKSGFHILNETNVESLMCITALFEQLLYRNEINSTNSNNNESENTVRSIKKCHGQNIAKHFFNLMPYVALQDSKRLDVITVNLKLFSICGKLKMFDNSMKAKLKKFIEGSLSWKSLDRGHCKSILDMITYLEKDELRTRFLIHAANFGHSCVVADFLGLMVHPTSGQNQSAVSKLISSSIQWSEILPQLIQSWPTIGTDLRKLFDVLTFVAFRQLTNVKSVLSSNATKLKELMDASKDSTILDSANRAFLYADAMDIFKIHF